MNPRKVCTLVDNLNYDVRPIIWNVNVDFTLRKCIFLYKKTIVYIKKDSTKVNAILFFWLYLSFQSCQHSDIWALVTLHLILTETFWLYIKCWIQFKNKIELFVKGLMEYIVKNKANLPYNNNKQKNKRNPFK